MSAPSQVEICNLALSRISQKPITDINDGTSRQAKVLLGIWSSAVRDTLRSNNWPFATVIKPLNQLSNYTPFQYQYAYIYPQNCLTFWKMFPLLSLAGYADVINNGGMGTSFINCDKNLKGAPFRELYDDTNNQKVLVTDAYQAYGEYTIEISDYTLFDANFVSSLAYKLAAEVAQPLNGDAALGMAMAKAFSTSISETQRMSSYETNEQPQQESSWINARG